MPRELNRTLRREYRMELESTPDPIRHMQMFQPCKQIHKRTRRVGKVTLRLSAIIDDFIWMADLVLLVLVLV